MRFKVGDKVSIIVKNVFGRPDLEIDKVYSGTVTDIRTKNNNDIFIKAEGCDPYIVSARGHILVPNNAVNKMLYPELKEFSEKWLSYEV